jgi:WD40 repeat protein/DNA-binding winged helix-turn-helix (wHTH) protein
MSREIKHLYKFGEYYLDLDKRLLLRGDEPVPLERKEFDVLEYMAEHSEGDLKREDFKKAVWGDEGVGEGRITQIVSSVRAKLNGNYIETVWGVGYRFNVKVIDISRIPDEACPWMGLDSFSEEDARYFYGREEEIQNLVERLKDERFIAIVGSSGRGKSSLAQAGVAPRLRQIGWRIKTIRPTHAPLRQLAAAILELRGSPLTEQAIDTLVNQLRSDEKTFACACEIGQSEAPAPILLLVDQFEEIFSPHVDDVDRERFISNLLAALKTDEYVFILITVRTDFLTTLESYSNIWPLVSSHQHGVKRFDRSDLRLVIEKPAESVRLKLDKNLPDIILDDLGEAPGALPLLSHTMAEMFKRREGLKLTIGAYLAIGRVKGAITHHADAVFTSLSVREQEIAKHILIMLTDIGPRPVNDVGRRVELKELVPNPKNYQEARSVVQKLADERLITTGSDSETLNPEDGNGRLWVEFSHLSLARHWARLARWLNEKRRALRVFETLDADAKEWERHQRNDPELLYGSHRLENALKEYEDFAEFTKEVHREFLQASKKLEGRRRRKQLAIKWLVATVSVLIIVTVLVAVKLQGAKEQRKLSDSLRRASDSISQLSSDPELSLLLAIESGKLAMTRQAEAALRQSLATSHVRAEFVGHKKQLISVALSPDGKYLLTAGLDPEARIWDLATKQTVKTFGGHAKGLSWAAYSPDGGRIVTASSDGAARVWDVNSGQILAELRGHKTPNKEGVNHAIFSPDGSRIVDAGEDGTALVWDIATRQVVHELREHTNYINTVAFSPDGRFIATASGDNTARIWDAQTGKRLAVLVGHQDSVLNLAFSGDARKLVTASRDRTARIWDVSSGAEKLLISGHSLQVNSAVFSPDGRSVLTASKDGTARIWDAQTGKSLLELLGHTSAINTAIFSADGRYVFTASGDFTARMWAVQVAEDHVGLLGHNAAVHKVIFSPDGSQALTASDDNTAVLWDVKDGHRIKIFPHPDRVSCAVFSPDGRTVATAAADGIGRLWDVSSGDVRELPRSSDSLYSIAFSPDGEMIVTAGKEHTVRVWRISTRQLIRELPEHEGEVYQAVFSPDGRAVATAGQDGKVRIWESATGRKLFERDVKTGAITNVTFSPDGQYVLASCLDSTARVWTVRDGSEITNSDKAIVVLRGHDLRLNSAAFSPNGLLVMTASDDRTVRLWELSTGRTLFQIADNDSPVKEASFSPDGRMIAVADDKGQVEIYDCKICGATGNELLSLAESYKRRNLTADEVSRFLTLSK